MLANCLLGFAGTLVLALAACSGEPGDGRLRNEEGKMKEWVSRSITEAPPPQDDRSRQVPAPAFPNPHPRQP